jgi:peptidoglycan-associated lipoprotein
MQKAVAAATALQSAAHSFNGEWYLKGVAAGLPRHRALQSIEKWRGKPAATPRLPKEDLTMQTKIPTLMILVAILGLLLCAGACHRERIPAPPPPEKAAAAPPPPAPTLTLNADPDTIDFNNTVNLSWSSQNATQLDLEPGVGNVQSLGSLSVTLRNSTTYILSASGPGGTQTATVRVTVRPPGPPPPPPPPSTGDLPFDRPHVVDAYFDFEKASIRPDADIALTGDANFLREHRSFRFTIEGYCDDRGSEEYNLALGDRRATAAKDFLVNAGVSVDRISTITYGKARPVCIDQTEECWQKNRRAHFHYGAESK